MYSYEKKNNKFFKFFIDVETFIKMALFEIDFYFEVFKQLKNHVYLTAAT